MGTYTTNYNLFMPTIGEQGWGELVNNNFSTIDTTMAGLNTRMGTAETNITSLTTRMGTAETTLTSNISRIGTLETETDVLDGRIMVLEAGNFDGNVSAETFNGDLYVNLSSTSTFVIGTYTVLVDDSAASKAYTLKNKGTYGTVSLTITDIQSTTIKGFKANNVSVAPSIKFNMGIAYLSEQTLSIYKNGTLIGSKTTKSSDDGTFTTSTFVTVGDVLSANVYNSSNFASAKNCTMSISLTSSTGDLYLA